MEESIVDSVGEKELKAFDDTKLGVKGLVDSGVVNIPGIVKDYPQTRPQIPVIDFQNIKNSDRRKQIVAEVQKASEEWGYFQAVNHGIPLSVLKGMIDGTRLFHEKDVEIKKQMERPYDPLRKVNYTHSNARETLLLTIRSSNPIIADDLPESCRSTTMEYVKYIHELGDTICELLSQALGLKAEKFKAMEIPKGWSSVGASYYPLCPETTKMINHTDISFFTILLQDHVGGLQVLHEDKWYDAEPIAGGGLVVVIGDLLQMASNDKFKSVIHRVVVNNVEPRISVGCFYHGSDQPLEYRPIEDLVSEENPPLYRGLVVRDVMGKFFSDGLFGEKLRNLYKL